MGGMGWAGLLVGCAMAAAYGGVTGRVVAGRLARGDHRRYEDERERPAPSYRLVPVAVALVCALIAAGFLCGWVRPDTAAGVAGLPLVSGLPVAGPPDRPLGAAAVSALAYVLPVPLFAALAAIDRDVHRLPDRLTLPVSALVAALLAAASATGGTWDAYRRGLLGGLLLVAGFGVLHLLSRGRFGLGDVKLAASLGMLLAWLSWGRLLGGAYAMFLVGGLTALVLLARRRTRRDSAIAFGPAMVAGALLGVCLPG